MYYHILRDIEEFQTVCALYFNLKMNRDFANVPVMRTPGENSGTTMKRFMRVIEEKYNTKFINYRDFHKWSIDNLAEFWAEFWDFSGIIYSKKYDKVIDLSVPMDESPKWFPGALLNYAENLLKYRDDRTALILASEDKEPRTVTFSQMYEKVKQYAAAFRNIGLQKGDVVACYMSNREEPVFAMLGAVSIGAIWTGALPLLGSQAVLNRLKLVSPKVLLTIDRFMNNRIEIELLEKVQEIVDGLPTLQKVIVVPSNCSSKSKDITGIKNSCFLDDFLKLGLDETGNIPPMVFEQVSFSHPVLICFTSGTTGLPKAMLHGCGALLPTAKDFVLQFDCGRDSIWFSMSPVGWVSWNMMAALSFSGVGILLFEGVPYYLSPTYFWDLVDKHKITNLFLPAKVLNDFVKLGYAPTDKHRLSTVKTCVSGGSVVKPQAYDFMYKRVKKDIVFSATYGCTEIVGTCISLDPTMNIYKGEIPIICLGVDVQCVNESGKPVEGEYGDLIIAQPSPILLLGLWGDADGSMAKKSYFRKFPGKFSIGDYGMVNPTTKGFIICGRSDETLKQRGTRFGSSEIYHVLDGIPELQDSVCVSQYNKDMDERAVLFLKMKAGHSYNDSLENRVRDAISRELTPAHVPDIVIEAKEIPYSANGKKMEIIVKNIINKRPFNAESIINPDCLKSFCNVPELQNF